MSGNKDINTSAESVYLLNLLCFDLIQAGFSWFLIADYIQTSFREIC